MDDMVHEILNMSMANQALKITMPCPVHQRQIMNNASESGLHSYRTSNRDVQSEKDYIEEYRRKDDEEYLKLTSSIIFDKKNPSDNMSEVTAFTEDMLCKKNTTEIYQTYNFAYRPKINLPILTIRDKIVSIIASNSVVVIHGSTGCGKTTQVPQFILDAEFKKKEHCNIIVTQPRRIAALSVAKRVSQERGWPVGTIVGYQIGLIKNRCSDTRITYCTTGVLLHTLINKKHMMDYTHIILDEVHERDEDMDFLLLVVKKLLRTNSMMVKVILMSATIDVNKFAEYFSSPVGDKLLPAPVIDIPKASPHNVSVYYLDEMENVGNVPEVSMYEPRFTFVMIEFCTRILYIFDDIDEKDNERGSMCERPAVLIFLPGIQEIENLHIMLTSMKHADAKWNVVILHSLISTEDQESVFKKPSKGFRRIILSTNIAESSITVPDVKYVIDFCLTKILINEPESNYQYLQLCWASKSNCQQRAGRTGRVMDGRVYRMVPRLFYDTVLRNEAIPEMLRIPLANVILKMKVLDMGEPKALLALSLDPPSLSNLRNTILLLKEVGALFNRHYDVEEFNGDLTPLGRIMAALPLNIHVSKLIVLGHVFGVLQDAIIIAASMTVKDIFNIGFHELESTYHEKIHWAAKSSSDSIACLNAFKVWRNDKTNHRINSISAEKEWARRKGLRIKALREIDALIADITVKLHTFGIREHIGANKHTWNNYSVNHTFVIKFIIAGAFYPNYFVKLPGMKHRQEDIAQILSNRDPMNTVILRGWPLKQPGPLYSKRFQEIFAQHMKLEDHENITVSFDGSNRVYIEYERNNRVTNDGSFVRNAIKMRQCRLPIEINLLNENEAIRRANEFGLMDVFGKTKSSFIQEPCERYMYNKNHNKKPYPKLPEQTEYQSKVILQGPISPIEVQLTHIVAAGASKRVSIEATSVNSVLLDTCPEKSRGPLLVAQTISRDRRNMTHLILRNTTLLPDIPGLTSLIILIFTPYMELRRNPLGTRYTGALCGLGYNYSTGQNIFPEHDLENIFDIEITMNDLQTINKLRHWMNVAMHFNNDTKDKNQNDLIVNCQNQIKKALYEIIYKTREPQMPILTSNFQKWNLYDETLFLEPAQETSRTCHVYTLHKALELNKRNVELEEMIEHLLELELLAYEDPRETCIKPISCKLCLIDIYDIINLRVHLSSEQHMMKQRMIRTTAEFGDDIQNILTKMRL